MSGPISRNGVPRPFLKWAGGKGQLLPELLRRVPGESRRYHEPFLGGGALFFALEPGAAFLTDINEELVNCYEVVRDDPDRLIDELRKHANAAEHFYAVRALQPARLDSVRRAARVIYLNKTCYNGLYRENSKGRFNVPFGRYKNPAICDEANLRAASRALSGQTIRTGPFDGVLAQAEPGDFVYFDPPYAPVNATSSFTAYSKGGFSFEDQERLAGVFRELSDRGCFVMLSNSDVGAVEGLYGGYRVERVTATRAINSKGDRRGPIHELIVRNY